MKYKRYSFRTLITIYQSISDELMKIYLCSQIISRQNQRYN